MINVITELSKYVILTLMIVYTFHCFYMVWRQDEEEKRELLHQQLTMIFFIDFTAFLVIYLKSMDFRVILFYIEMMIFFAAIQILYRIIFQNASLLLLNNMCMLLSVGFIMLCRLSLPSATKQLLIVAAGSAVSLVIPVMIRKMKFLKFGGTSVGSGLMPELVLYFWRQFLFWQAQATVQSFLLWESSLPR